MIRPVVCPVIRTLIHTLIRTAPLLLLGTELAAQAGPPVLGRARCEQTLEQLDQLFDRGDADAYAAAFTWDRPSLQQLLVQRLRQVFAQPARLQRRSQLHAEPRPFGARTVLLVRHEFRAGTATGTAPGEASGVEHSFIVLDSTAATPLLQIEVPPDQLADVSAERFTCAACNYRVGGTPGWLCVPVRPDRADDLEAVCFLLLGSDLGCEVAVHIDELPLPAPQAIEQLARAIATAVPGTRIGPVEPWTPPGLQAPLPPHLQGARATVTLPDGSVNLLHTTTLGALRHVLVVRGSAAAMASHKQEVEALLASYELLQPDAELAELAARPLRLHHGGVLAGCEYRNDRWHLCFTGPLQWHPVLRCTGAAFQVVWSCPGSSGRLYLSGFTPPPGLPCWSRVTADRWLADLCERAQLQLQPDDAGWLDPDASRFALRTVIAAPKRSEQGQPASRTIRLCLRDDLLVVIDGQVTSDGDDGLLRAAFTSLRAR